MRLKSLHHVHLRTTDLNREEKFANDFGLRTRTRDAQTLFMHTLGGEHYAVIAEQGSAPGFVGLGFLVEGMEDLEEAVRDHGATPIRELDRPGRGYAVNLTDPQGGQVELIAGLERGTPGTGSQPLLLNHPAAYPRQNASQSMRQVAPPDLYRLGHVGIYSGDIDAMIAWYQQTLGLLASDVLHEPGNPSHRILAFMRLDRGGEPVDHHCVALARAGHADCHHISFEAQDFEAQFRAHRWLLQAGYQPVAGVGRHGQGSHVFDTWFNWDRSYRWETYSDTDQLTADFPSRSHGMNDSELDLWGSSSLELYFTPPEVLREKGII